LKRFKSDKKSTHFIIDEHNFLVSYPEMKEGQVMRRNKGHFAVDALKIK